MYAARAEGRGRVRLFDAALGEDVEQRYALAADLRAALAADELAMHLQPVVDLRGGRVVGVEALARWEHPVLGRVPPSRFVPVAEAHGLAAELDRWALRRALGEVARLRSRGALPADAYVAVNLSARNLADPALEEAVVSEAAAAGLPAELVVLEITESSIMQDPEEAAGSLRRLRARGFGVAVDDFGTGYSSLAYLRDLPVTALKIDRSFVADITTSPDALSIVASVLDLARPVDAVVVAEGVETQRQADLLRDLGCPYGQGWLWSRAVPPEQVEGAWPRAGTADVLRAPRGTRGPDGGLDGGLDGGRPAPVPVRRTAPVAWSTTRQFPIAPVAPAASRMTIRDTVVAEPHLIEMAPVAPAGDQ